MRLFLLLFLTTQPVAAAMSGAEFEAYVKGKTFTYADRGQVYGIEEYLPNRRVRWLHFGQECIGGRWFDAGPRICFLYDDEPFDPKCWEFEIKEGKLSAVFVSEPPGQELYEVERSEDPLMCPGPHVGV